MEYKVPYIIKEALGEDTYNQISNVIKNTQIEQRTYTFLASSEFFEEFEKILKESVKNITN